MTLPDLYICLTPLQALIAAQLIRQTQPQPAELLMICYAGADNEKFRHYFRQTQVLCRRSDYVVIEHGRWMPPRLRRNIGRHYRTVRLASVDNDAVQYVVSHLRFERLETFDDGTANLYTDSILYRNPPMSAFRKLRRALQGIRYQTEDLRRLSQCHYTLYPERPNIAAPTVPLALWQDNTPRLADTDINEVNKSSLHPFKILLGQPLFDRAEDNIALFARLQRHVHADAYFPHPREHYTLPDIAYLHSDLIFEDYLAQQLQKQPAREFHIYHLGSSAAFNVHAFDRVRVHALRPEEPLFANPTWTQLYHIQSQLNIPVETV